MIMEVVSGLASLPLLSYHFTKVLKGPFPQQAHDYNEHF